MKRILFATILIAGFAVTANAATLTVTADAATYNVGDTITLSITADGESDPARDQSFVILNHDLALVTGLGGSTGTFTQGGGFLTSSVGSNQGSCAWAIGRDDQCLVIDQLHGSETNPADAPVFGTYTYVADAVGVANFNWQDAVGSDFNFFGLGNGTDTGTAPAGTSVNIVPEPTTAALIGLGLLGLGLGGRRRS